MPTYSVRHVTTYYYGSPVAFGAHRLLLHPRESFDQRTVESHLHLEPRPSDLNWSEDSSGNLIAIAQFGKRARKLRVEARNEVEQSQSVPGEPRIAEHARTAPFSYGAEQMPDLARFIERQHPDPDHLIDRWARRILADDPAAATWSFLARVNGTIRREFAYLRREEKGIQDPVTTLRLGRGSCRDFAVLMSEAVRALGFAARFVSGYLYVSSPDSAAAHTAGNTHAWLQVFIPGAGWIDFDPTSGSVGNADLIRVAVVRDPAQAVPLSGTFMGFPSDFLRMEVQVEVTLACSSRASAEPLLNLRETA